ncbi:MAG: hypothetical protein NT113_17075, partial [Hyphomicrobiales bacterium]|nr:hypothetical protein [Hyphomicrobiales bacterium]
MYKTLSWVRYISVCLVAGTSIFCGYPLLYMMQHGSNSLVWPNNAGPTPLMWFDKIVGSIPDKYPDVLFLGSTYGDMWLNKSLAFSGGGFLAASALTVYTVVACTLILGGGEMASRRVRFGQYGNAKWAAPGVLSALDKGIEIGINPTSLRAVRIQIEGNLLTIAPPRSGKTGGFVIPNLAFPEPDAWAG